MKMTDAEIDVVCCRVRKICRAFDPHSHDEAAGAFEATGRIVAAIIITEAQEKKETEL